MSAVVVTVPGLRGDVEDHWQTRLANARPDVVPVAPLGRDNPSLVERIAALQAVVEAAPGPVVIVAHSAGVLVTVHWAARFDSGKVRGALLATPPDLAAPLPSEYPSLDVLKVHGWLPIPRRLLTFPSIVAASANDPLSDPVRIRVRHVPCARQGSLNPWQRSPRVLRGRRLHLADVGVRTDETGDLRLRRTKESRQHQNGCPEVPGLRITARHLA